MHCTNEPNVSIPQLANLLIERSQNSNWVVVFKALVTTHHLMCYGNEVKLLEATSKKESIFYKTFRNFSDSLNSLRRATAVSSLATFWTKEMWQVTIHFTGDYPRVCLLTKAICVTGRLLSAVPKINTNALCVLVRFSCRSHRYGEK